MKYVIVTGASRGVGSQIASTLLNTDFNVIGISRTVSDSIKELQSKFPGKFWHVQFDLAQSQAIKSQIFQKINDNNDEIIGYVNNAAIAYDDIITNANYETLSNMFQVNVFTPMLITKYVIRNMLLHNNIGSIVHLSSISVHTGYKGLSMYAASKGALEAFSKNTAREWGSRKIRSNCIVAGFMDTDMSSGLTEDQKKRIYQRTSLKEGTSIDSVAETVLFLLSDKSKSITGQNIFVDNGTI
jgi:3-oxoacyl-[acyl-carrier protein] reductase